MASALLTTAIWASPIEPASTGGIAMVDRGLSALTTHRRLLVVGAHPDDEDTTLLTYVRLGLDGEAAYLSLSRGEGGQNLIGPELGVGLGLIRTGELVAARSIEGTRQYFTRAFDFGYSRSLEETFRCWSKAVLLEDAVRVVRRFKPQIVVAVFPPDERAGHGQHQASGVIAGELMQLAGPPDRYPQLTAAGLPPWQPEVLFRSAWWDPDLITARFALDDIDPFSGKSVYQIAASSRSMHRSQDMGTLQRLGRIEGGVAWKSGSAGEGESELFDGVDTSLAAIASYLEVGPFRRQVEMELEGIERDARAARHRLSPVDLESSVPVLAGLVQRMSELAAEVSQLEGRVVGAESVSSLLEEKLGLISDGLIAAAGVGLDAESDRATVTPGGTLEMTTTVWNSNSRPLAITAVDILASDDWRVVESEEPEPHPRISGLEQRRYKLEVEHRAEPTTPYFLARSLTGDLYDWTDVAPETRGLPWQSPPLVVRFELEIEGVDVSTEREVVFRKLDQAIGEVREPIRIVPVLEIDVEPEMILWPVRDRDRRRVRIGLHSNSDSELRGRLLFGAESLWPELASRDFSIAEPNGEQVLNFELELPDGVQPGQSRLDMVAELDDGERFDASYPLIRYPHIRPATIVDRAHAEIEFLDLVLPDIGLIGYVRGASDRVPEVLTEVGLEVELLSAETLESGDFSRFGAIVVGSRAYETDPALKRANSRLMAYVEDGGLLLVQYQQYQFVEGGFAPYPLDIARPHGRVTDEDSPVKLLEPSHSVLNRPNRLQPSDWQDWVQERGLYFASTWDSAYLPILSVHDVGQPEERGSLLIAEMGDGIYVYSGLSFFRQLPAGVPGAIRLFSNLLALGDPG